MCLKLCTLNFQLVHFLFVRACSCSLTLSSDLSSTFSATDFSCIQSFHTCSVEVQLVISYSFEEVCNIFGLLQVLLNQFLTQQGFKTVEALPEATIPMFCEFSPHIPCVGFAYWNCLCEIKQAALHFAHNIFFSNSIWRFLDLTRSQFESVLSLFKRAQQEFLQNIKDLEVLLGKIETCDSPKLLLHS